MIATNEATQTGLTKAWRERATLSPGAVLRLVLVCIVGAVVLALAYWFTRPSEYSMPSVEYYSEVSVGPIVISHGPKKAEIAGVSERWGAIFVHSRSWYEPQDGSELGPLWTETKAYDENRNPVPLHPYVEEEVALPPFAYEEDIGWSRGGQMIYQRRWRHGELVDERKWYEDGTPKEETVWKDEVEVRARSWDAEGRETKPSE